METFQLIIGSIALTAGLGLMGSLIYECAVWVYGKKEDED